jgi:hypothetical protein
MVAWLGYLRFPVPRLICGVAGRAKDNGYGTGKHY